MEVNRDVTRDEWMQIVQTCIRHVQEVTLARDNSPTRTD